MNEDLQSACDSLKEYAGKLLKEIEDKNQHIYNCKKQLSLATVLEGDYIQEIEALQLLQNTKIDELNKEIKRLESVIVNLREKYEGQLLNKFDSITHLKQQIEERKKNKNVDCRDDSHTEPDEEKNQQLRDQIKTLSYNLVETQMGIESLRVENSELIVTQYDLLRVIDEAKQSLTKKVQELKGTKVLAENFQDDIFQTKINLESVKSKPLDPSKQGNSLFGEVEDSRLKMEKSILQMKKNYAESKRNVCVKLKKMVSLREENLKLCEQLKTIKDEDEKYDKEIQTLKENIVALEPVIAEYKRELMKDQKFTGENLPSYAIEFANNMIRTKWHDIEKIREKLHRVSKEKLETYKEIQNTNTELRKRRRKAQQLKIKVEELENSILEIQLQNSSTETSGAGEKEKMKTDKEIVKTENKISLQPINKAKVPTEENIKIGTKLETKKSPNTPIARNSHTFITSRKHSQILNFHKLSAKSKSLPYNCDVFAQAGKSNLKDTSISTTSDCSDLHTECKGDNKHINKVVEELSVQSEHKLINESMTDNSSGFFTADLKLNSANIPECVRTSECFVDKKKLLSYMNDIGYFPAEHKTLSKVSTDAEVNVNLENTSNISLSDDSLLSTSFEFSRLDGESILRMSVNNHTKYFGDITQTDFNNGRPSLINEESLLLCADDAGHTPGANRKKIIGYYTLTTPECNSKQFSESDNEENLKTNGVQQASARKRILIIKDTENVNVKDVVDDKTIINSSLMAQICIDQSKATDAAISAIYLPTQISEELSKDVE